jgi:hypothetical protein
MRFTVKVEWQQEDGTVATAELGRLDGGGLHSANDLGLKLADAKPILARLQNIVMTMRVRSYCKSVRNCPSCRAPRRIKDYSTPGKDSCWIVTDAPALALAVDQDPSSLPLLDGLDLKLGQLLAAEGVADQ